MEVRLTTIFRDWLSGLRDTRAAERISIRITRLQKGLLGDIKPVGGGISELRVDTGAGYRVYLVQRGLLVVVLLCGGDKATQSRDINRAREIAADLEE